MEEKVNCNQLLYQKYKYKLLNDIALLDAKQKAIAPAMKIKDNQIQNLEEMLEIAYKENEKLKKDIKEIQNGYRQQF